jgi:hypothetical protein
VLPVLLQVISLLERIVKVMDRIMTASDSGMCDAIGDSR